MTNRLLTASSAAAALILIAVSNLHAQTSIVKLQPENTSRWDTAGYIGWLGNASDVPSPVPSGSDWYQATSFDVSGGYYWTPHLKVELGVATATEGDADSYETIYTPGENFPYFRSRHYRFQSTSLSGGVVYQFLENSWFHPLVGTGVDLVRERERVDSSQQGPPSRNSAAFLIPALPASTRVSYAGRPFVDGGFKAYISERAFVRSDLRASWSSGRVDSVVWRAGLGVDF